MLIYRIDATHSNMTQTHASSVVVDYKIITDTKETGKEHFASLRQLQIKPIFSDHTQGEQHPCAVLMRHGIDAVMVVPYVRQEPIETSLVLLRYGQRPAVWLRRFMELPIQEPDAPARLCELVAGIREWHEHGIEGLRKRACIELQEEVGLHISPEDLVPLGPGFLPSPGLFPEKIFPFCVELSLSALQQANPLGDGGIQEMGASIEIITLQDAIQRVDQGLIIDAKTELGLLRLMRFLNTRTMHP